jgi:hypothetical protein
VVIAARPRPVQVAEAVWSRWIAPDSPLSRTRMPGFVPAHEQAGSRFAPLVATYAQTWPRLVGLTLSGALAPPDFGLSPGTVSAKAPVEVVAQR